MKKTINALSIHKNINSNTAASAGADPQPAPVTPDQVVEALRAIRASLGELSSVTPRERKRLARDTNVSVDVVRAQINLIAAADEIANALGTPAEVVQALTDTSGSWRRVESGFASCSPQSRRATS